MDRHARGAVQLQTLVSRRGRGQENAETIKTDIASEADPKVFVTDIRSEADLTIFKTDVQSDAEWVNSTVAHAFQVQPPAERTFRNDGLASFQPNMPYEEVPGVRVKDRAGGL